MFKRANVVMLPTNEKASLCISQDKLTRFHGIEPDNEVLVYRHLYIVSNDEIKEGEILPYLMKWERGYQLFNSHNGIRKSKLDRAKRIIATTDTSIMIKSEQAGDNTWFNPYPRPSDSFIAKFIEEYNKGNIITDVMVEYEQKRIYGDELDIHGYNVDVVKVNPKDNTITIKKIKDSWNREEVVNLIIKFQSNYNNFINDKNRDISTWFDKWLNDNL